MTALRPAPRAGFTLVELLVGLTLSTALLAAVLSTYLYLARNLARLAHQQTLESEVRRAVDYFTQDARSAAAVTITPVPAPDFQIAFVQPATSAGPTETIYSYSREGAERSILGRTIAVPAHALIRITRAGGVAGEPQVLVRNLVDRPDACVARFFDSAGKPYDQDIAPYTPVSTYSAGIKQASLQLAAQAGDSATGTRTPVYEMASSRVLLRNRTWLP